MVRSGGCFLGWRSYPSGSFTARVSMWHKLPKMTSASGWVCKANVLLRLKVLDITVLPDVLELVEVTVFEVVNGSSPFVVFLTDSLA